MPRNRYLQRVALVGCLLPMTACAVKCDEYKHFIFKLEPSAQITATRSPALKGLKGVESFPVSYSIPRTGYQLKLQIDETTYGPTAVIHIESSDSKSVRPIIPENSADTFASCVSYRAQRNAVVVAWLDRPNCEARRSVDLEVLDASGVTIGKEKLPFDVITNGRYCVTDAL